MIQTTLSIQHLHIHSPCLQVADVVLSGEIQCLLNAGELHVLRGANGAGKSTLLRAVAQTLPGRAILYRPEYGLRDELLVHHYLQDVLAHLKIPPVSGHLTVEYCLSQVGLSHWQYERIGTLSSGQKSRLGLCVLLVAPFTVWLLDEPLNALDQEGCVVLAQAIEKHLQAGGFLFMATHVDPVAVVQYLPRVVVNLNVLNQSGLQGDSTTRKPQDAAFQSDSLLHKPKLMLPPPLGALFKREWKMLNQDSKAVLWGALFHWMVLSFFGIGLGKITVEFAQVAVWVSVLLAMLLGAKDWFTEDHRVGWFQFLTHINPSSTGTYWLIRVLCLACAQVLVLVPVTGLVAVQFGLSVSQATQLTAALIAGIWAMAPLLGVVALLVMLTRGGAVLAYLLALPLLVPILVFGLEASQAVGAGRNAQAPLAVLFSLGLLAYLLGAPVAKRLIQLIQE